MKGPFANTRYRVLVVNLASMPNSQDENSLAFYLIQNKVIACAQFEESCPVTSQCVPSDIADMLCEPIDSSRDLTPNGWVEPGEITFGLLRENEAIHRLGPSRA